MDGWREEKLQTVEREKGERMSNYYPALILM